METQFKYLIYELEDISSINRSSSLRNENPNSYSGLVRPDSIAFSPLLEHYDDQKEAIDVIVEHGKLYTEYTVLPVIKKTDI